MHLLECEATFKAEPAEVWKVWTDVERWPEWDVSKEIAQLDGPFEPGVSGWAKQRGNLGGCFTITAVDDGRHWVTECPIPLGKVVFNHLLEPVAEGHVRVVKRVEVYGGFGSLLRLIAPKMRRDITESLAALERQLSALASIGQSALGAVTNCAAARFRRGVCLLSGRRRPVLPGVPGWAPAPTAPGWFSFRSAR